MKSVALLFVGRVQYFKTQAYHQNIIWALKNQGYLDIDAFLSHNGKNTMDPNRRKNTWFVHPNALQVQK